MNEADYPALWRASTKAAANCQRWFLRLVLIQLAVLAATGLIAAWVPGDAAVERVVSVIVVVLMFSALIIGLVLRLHRLDDDWFRCRALAENSKRAAWRFMMKHKPRTVTADEDHEKELLEELRQLRERLPQVEKHLSKQDGGGGEVTVKMREVHALPMTERLKFYRENRLQDQIDWYRRNAKTNADAESRWFWLILLTESFAVLAAGARVLSAQEYNPTGGVVALAACLVAWTQTKRYSDLANTYGVACRDLNGLLTQVEHVHDEDDLQTLVVAVELAISREHRLWVEQRSGSA